MPPRLAADRADRVCRRESVDPGAGCGPSRAQLAAALAVLEEDVLDDEDDVLDEEESLDDEDEEELAADSLEEELDRLSVR